jgi:lysyl-tRNA synthetase class 2
LLSAAGFAAPIGRMTYAELWQRRFDGDPHTLPTEALAAVAAALPCALGATERGDRAGLFDRIYVQALEPALAGAGAVFVHGYPVEQRAYARLSSGAVPHAERFELVIDGLEIANGYHEIIDPDEQRGCFGQENALRAARGLAAAPVDEDWLGALASGMPACAGVALGVERLHMALRGERAIDSVAPWTLERP